MRKFLFFFYMYLIFYMIFLTYSITNHWITYVWAGLVLCFALTFGIDQKSSREDEYTPHGKMSTLHTGRWVHSLREDEYTPYGKMSTLFTGRWVHWSNIVSWSNLKCCCVNNTLLLNPFRRLSCSKASVKGYVLYI
jgi:hypothetical protein